jgi:ATP-dependent helicase HepA
MSYMRSLLHGGAEKLIDEPDRSVFVLIPAHMVEQWRRELLEKFHIDEFGLSACEVAPYERAIDAGLSPDLLIVDEAHHVVMGGTMAESMPVQSAIARLATAVPRLLLLSATPPVGEEDRLFGLVHLLDPALYPLSERDAFKQKVSERGRIGRLLLALQPGSASLPLRQAANQAKRLFAADSEAVRAADAVISAGSDQAALDRAAETLREHIAETHRIHQRLLRSRRVDAERASMRRRGPVVIADQDPDLPHVRLDWPSDVRTREVCQALEGWHVAARAHATSHPDSRPLLISRCVDLYEAMGRGLPALAKLVTNLDPEFPQEADHLAAMATQNAEQVPYDRHGTIVRMMREWQSLLPQTINSLPAKVICFASDPDDADALSARLRQVLGPGAITRLTSTQKAADIIARFAAHKEEWVLVCDRSGEEGLNLQFAYGILHADLPFNPNKLEQRIGRLDRYGRRQKSVAHRVFLPDHDEESVWRAWFDLLANGFLIFNHSVSDVQFRLEEFRSRICASLFEQGGFGLAQLISEVRARLAEERLRLDEQHVFEAAIGIDEAPDQIVLRIEDEEAEEGDLGADLRGRYEKPSERRVREKAEAIRRARKLARKKLQREGLLPMKPRALPGAFGRAGPPRAPRF